MRLRLPLHAYVPGQGMEPDRAPLEQAKALVPERFAAGVPAQHPALQFGVELYEAGYFWEAHEVLEAVWKAAPMNGRDRIALRALIQFANAALKKRMGQHTAHGRLLEDAFAALWELSLRPDGEDGMESLAAELDARRLMAYLKDQCGNHPSLKPYLSCKKMQRSAGEA
jgi:hypothetical protein